MDDIKKTLVYIPQDKMQYWNPITSWPITTASHDEGEESDQFNIPKCQNFIQEC